jgi:hypothetical protein
VHLVGCKCNCSVVVWSGIHRRQVRCLFNALRVGMCVVNSRKNLWMFSELYAFPCICLLFRERDINGNGKEQSETTVPKSFHRTLRRISVLGTAEEYTFLPSPDHRTQKLITSKFLDTKPWDILRYSGGSWPRIRKTILFRDVRNC